MTFKVCPSPSFKKNWRLWLIGVLFGGLPKRVAPQIFPFSFYKFQSWRFASFWAQFLKGLQILSFEARDLSFWREVLIYNIIDMFKETARNCPDIFCLTRGYNSPPPLTKRVLLVLHWLHHMTNKVKGFTIEIIFKIFHPETWLRCLAPWLEIPFHYETRSFMKGDKWNVTSDKFCLILYQQIKSYN